MMIMFQLLMISTILQKLCLHNLREQRPPRENYKRQKQEPRRNKSPQSALRRIPTTKQTSTIPAPALPSRRNVPTCFPACFPSHPASRPTSHTAQYQLVEKFFGSTFTCTTRTSTSPPAPPGSRWRCGCSRCACRHIQTPSPPNNTTTAWSTPPRSARGASDAWPRSAVSDTDSWSWD